MDKESREDEPSVLDVIESLSGSAPRVNLPAGPGEPSPVVRPDPQANPEVRGSRATYQVLGEIARGGVGVILRGHDRDIGRDVAMKLLREEHQDNPGLLQRFVEEAQINGQLQHPGIAPVYELGMQEDQRPFFTMKLIKGRTLSALLGERDTPVRVDTKTIGIFEQVCQTMAYAHSRGVIHRDLKPANVMVGAFGEVQVVDWGFAKVLPQGGVADEARAMERDSELSVIATVRSGPESSGSASVAGSVLGTPSYMPPEQARGELAKTDERSDVFSLGAMLCEILTGRTVYAGEEHVIQAAADCRLDAAMQRLDECEADRELVDLCRSCLAPAMAARPLNAGVLAEKLRGYLSGIEQRARNAELQATRARARQRMTLVVSGAVVLIMALGGSGAWWMQHQAEQHRATVRGNIESSLQEAQVAFLLGQEAPLENDRHWITAAAALQRVEEALAEAEGMADLREQHQDLAGAVQAASRNRGLLRDLSAIRDAGTEGMGQTTADYPTWADGEYARVFRDHDRDVDALGVDEMCLWVADLPIAFEIASHFDHWARVRRRTDSGADWQMLIHIANAADPDDSTAEVRGAVLDQSVPRLLELARSPARFDLPIRTMSLLGDALFVEGEVDEAFRVLKEAQAIDPGDYRSNVWLGLFLLREGRDLAQAARHLGIAAALRPGVAVLRVWQATALARSGDQEGALLVARELVRKEPDQGRSYVALITVHNLFREYEEALTAFRTATALDQELLADSELRSAWMGSLAGLGLHDRLQKTVDQILERVPDDPEALTMRARLRAAQGRTDAAIADFKQSFLIASLASAGVLEWHAGQRDEAGRTFRQALGAWARNNADESMEHGVIGPLTLFLLLIPEPGLADIGRARRLADRLTDRYPLEAEAWSLQALTRYLQEDPVGALEAARRAEEVPMGHPVLELFPRLVAALACVELGQDDRAAAWMARAEESYHRQDQSVVLRLLAEDLHDQAAALLDIH